MYFEEWEDGFSYTSPSATITETHFVTFHSLLQINHPFHTSEEVAKNHPFGKRFATGTLAMCLSMGLTSRRGFREEHILGFLGLDKVRFTSPVFIGDTIQATEKLIEKKETSRPDRGVIKLETTVTNQRDEAVCTYEMTYLYERKPKE